MAKEANPDMGYGLPGPTDSASLAPNSTINQAGPAIFGTRREICMLQTADPLPHHLTVRHPACGCGHGSRPRRIHRAWSVRALST